MNSSPPFRLTAVWALLAAAALLPGSVRGADDTPHAGDKLVIESSTTKVPLNRATLTVEPLTRRDGKYSGSYAVDVSPVSFTSEKGNLSVNFPDEALRKLAQHTMASFHGDATNSSGKSRTIDGSATPTSADGGTITLKIISERGKLVFHTTYHFTAGR